jgi:hypothetical protein
VTGCGRGEVEGVDPRTEVFVLATAAITSIAFAVSAMNVVAVVLSHVLR